MENYVADDIVKPTNGIPFKMVQSSLGFGNIETITCSNCLNLVWDYVDCAKCGALFCKYCINKSIKEIKDACPTCDLSPFKSTNNKTLANIFANVILKCPNSPQCKELISYSDYLTHQEICEFRKYYCINEGCGCSFHFNKTQAMKNHANNCQHKLIKCKYCNKELKKLDYSNHLKTECDKFKKCNICHKEMTKIEFETKHSETNCLKHQVELYKKELKESDKKRIKLENYYKEEIEKIKKENAELTEKYQSLLSDYKQLKKDMLISVGNVQILQKELLLCKKRNRDDLN